MLKKGEITTAQIVTIIILITSFLVILFFIYKLNPKEETTKNLCYNSVVLKSNSPIKSQISLDCHTNYICVSDIGSCKDADSGAVVVKSSDSVKSVANEIANCWGEFGEGKLDFIGYEGFKTRSCGICSKIYFSDKLDGNFVSTFSSNLADYMDKNKVSGKEMNYISYTGINVGDVKKIDLTSDKKLIVFYTISKRSKPFSVFEPTVNLIESSKINDAQCDDFSLTLA